jgi:hypothetical protein
VNPRIVVTALQTTTLITARQPMTCKEACKGRRAEEAKM